MQRWAAEISVSHFLHELWGKIFLLLYSITLPNLMCWLPLICEILGGMCIVIVCYLGYGVINFEINFILLIKPFLLHDQKVKTALKMKDKEFSIIFKKILLKQRKQVLLKGDSRHETYLLKRRKRANEVYSVLRKNVRLNGSLNRAFFKIVQSY